MANSDLRFSSKDFEKCWFLYQTEGVPHDLSIEQFCLKQGVPVNEFNKWYRDTHKRIHPIQVDGIPSEESKETSGGAPVKKENPVRILSFVANSKTNDAS